MNDIKLLPCPFCGGKPNLYSYMDHKKKDHWQVHCERSNKVSKCILECLDWDYQDPSKEKVIELWNRRLK